MRFFKHRITLLLSFSVLVGVGLMTSVSAQDTISSGFNVAQNIGEGALGTTDLRDIIVNVVNIALGFLGIIAVGILIYGGWLWMTSAGSADRVEKAKQTIRNAIIGIAIILAAWVIVFFVLRALFDATGGGPDACTFPEPDRLCGPVGCGGTQACESDNSWGDCTGIIPGCTGFPGASELLVTSRYPLGSVNTDVCLNSIIFATFNLPIDDTTVPGNFIVRECDDDTCTTYALDPVPGSATSISPISGEEVNSVVFTPSVVLQASTTYEVVILSDNVSNTGISSNTSPEAFYLSGNDRWDFISGTELDTTPPQVVTEFPANGATDICLATFLAGEFSEVMNPLTLVTGALNVGAAAGVNIPDYRTRRQYITTSPTVPVPHHAILNVNPNPYHDPNSTYHGTIVGAVTDACGNPMGADFGGPGNWQFDTGATIQCLPEISGISDSPYYEDTVTISGAYLDTATSVTFGNNTNAFVDTCLQPASPYLATNTCTVTPTFINIETTLPSGAQVNKGAQDGTIRVVTPAGSVNSPLSHDVKAPFIRSISTGRIEGGFPAASVDQFISLLGNDFGPPSGEVWFTNTANGIRYQAILACSGTTGWQDNQVIVTPPQSMGIPANYGIEFHVQVEIPDPVTPAIPHRSNIGRIHFDNEAAGPGLCSIDPPSATPGGPATLFDVIGENFEAMGPTVGDNEFVKFGVPGNAIDAVGNVPPFSLNFSGTQDKTGPVVSPPYTLAVPSIQPQANIGVFITDGNVTSNSLLFTVTAGAGPGPIIFEFNPTQGGIGQYVTITGNGFGNNQGFVHFYQDAQGVTNQIPASTILGDFNSFPLVCQGNLWSDSQIIVKTPNDPSFNTGDYYIAVEHTNATIGNSENVVPAQFFHNNADPTPGICLVNPPNGAVGDAVNIFGDNLGMTGDRVLFHNNIPATVPGVWNPNGKDIMGAEVPLGAETGSLFVEVGGSVLSNPYQFSVGLCTNAIDPDMACSAGYTCCGGGEFDGQCRLDINVGGESYSTCEVSQNQSVQSWTFTTGVGPGASCQSALDPDTGEPLSVPPNMCDPNPTICTGSDLICELSTCTCQAFGVVINKQCAVVPQSPSPIDGSQDACINTTMSVRFNASINPVTVGGITVEQCTDSSCGITSSTGITFNRIPVSDVITAGFDAIRIYPQDPTDLLNPDTWYQVTIPSGPGGILSATGIQLEDNFIWKFKTDPSGTRCSPAQCWLTPQPDVTVTAVDVDSVPPYSLDAGTFNCNLLYGDFPHSINSSVPAVGTVLPLLISDVPAPNSIVAHSEGRGQTIIKAINQLDLTITCTSKFIVATKIPEVTRRRPDCSTACINTTIGADFSEPISKADIIANTTIRLRQCAGPGDCTGGSLITLDPDPDAIQFNPPDILELYTRSVDILPQNNLLQGTTYQVELQADAIHSASNEELIQDPLGSGEYRWEFTTKSTGNGLCVIDHIEIIPENATTTAIGVDVPFSGLAFGPPDECNPGGQRLNPFTYSWTDNDPATQYGWSALSPQVADHTRMGPLPSRLEDIQPPPTGNGLIDPTQPFAAIGTDPLCSSGSCKTTIVGSVDPGVGEDTITCTEGGFNKCGKLKLICGYSTDDECTRPAPDGLGLPNHGLGYNTCCAPRPEIGSPIVPFDGQLNVCRNVIIEVPFNMPLEYASLSGNVILTQNVGNIACPSGTKSLLLAKGGSQNGSVYEIPTNPFKRIVFEIREFFRKLLVRDVDAAHTYSSGDNLCIVPSRANLDPTGTIINISPQQLLGATDEYLVIILGDDDFNDGVRKGIRSSLGVTMNGGTLFTIGSRTFNSELIGFTTSNDICEIGILEHEFVQRDPSSPTNYSDPPNTGTTELFFCADIGCLDNIANIPGNTVLGGNQHGIIVLARDSDTNQQLQAEFQYVRAGPDFYRTCPATTFVDACTPNDTSFAVYQNVSHIAVSDTFQDFSKDVSGTLRVNAQNPYKSNNKISKNLIIRLFVCENPWPSVSSFPFNDSNTNCLPGPGACVDTNFEFYYCRDAGGPGTQDDLPALEISRPVITSSSVGEICYGGSQPGTECTDDTECVCNPGDQSCNTPGICFNASIKDLVFPREGILSAPTDFTLANVPLGPQPGPGGTAFQEGGFLQIRSVDPKLPGIGYKIYWGLSSGEYSFSKDLRNLPGGNGQISNLDPNRDYYFAMTFYNLGGLARAESAYSPEKIYTPSDAIPPLKPINVTATSVNTARIDVTWDDDPITENDVAGYEIFVGTQSGSYLQSIDVGKVNSHTLSLSPLTEYFILVESYDSSGNRRTQLLTDEVSATTL